MSEKLDPLVIQLQLETDKVKSQLSDVEKRLDTFGSRTKSADNAMSGFGKSLKGLAGPLLAMLSVQQIAGFLSNATKEAVADAKSMELLAQQMRNTVDASSGLITQAEDSIKAMERQAAVADDEIRPAFARLVRTTKDVGEASRLTQLALDVSAGSGKDLNAVTIALTKAYQGNAGALTRLGINVKDAKDPIAELEKQFKGMAKTAANNDPYKRIEIAMGNIGEAVGGVMMPALNDFADWLDTVVPKIEEFFGAATDPTSEFYDGWADMETAVNNLNDAFSIVFENMSGNGASAFSFMGDLINFLSMGLGGTLALLADVGVAVGRLFTNWWDLGTKDPFENFNKFVDTTAKNMQEAEDKRRQRLFDKAADYTLDQGDKLFGSGGGGGKGGGAGDGKAAAAHKKRVDELVKFMKDSRKQIADELSKYNKAVDEANAEYTADIGKAQDEFTSTVAKITKERDDDLEKARKDHAKNVLSIEADYANRLQGIVQQSMDRLRSAFASATTFNVGSIYNTILGNDTLAQAIGTQVRDGFTVGVSWWGKMGETGGVGGLTTALKTRLEDARKLAANAAALSGAGYSQTFIEQIVGQGTDIGNRLSAELLKATPEAATELQKLYGDLETETGTGVDALAKKIYEKQGLATAELKKLYTATQSELTTALADELSAYNDSITDINTRFDEALGEAEASRDAALKDAQDTLTKALLDAADSFDSSLNDIKDKMNEKLKAMKDAAKDAAASIAKSYAAMKSAQFTADMGKLSATPAPALFDTYAALQNKPASAYSIEINQDIKSDASPETIADSTVSAIKFGIPISLLTA